MSPVSASCARRWGFFTQIHGPMESFDATEGGRRARKSGMFSLGLRAFCGRKYEVFGFLLAQISIFDEFNRLYCMADRR